MIRRDTFIQRYVDQNNNKKIQSQVIELEKFVDTQLVDANNLLTYINQNGLSGTDGSSFTQLVTSSIVNDAVHRDPSVLDKGAGRSGPNKEYAIWSSKLTDTNNNSVINTPYFDLVLNTSINGQLRIYLPTNTNKNAAYQLCQKYLQPLIDDSSQITQTQIDTLGFWGRKPIIGTNGTSAVLDPNAVQLLYDQINNRLIMIFSL